MKICLTTQKSRHLKIRLWLVEIYTLLFFCVLMLSVSTAVVGACIHDIIQHPTRTTSPQRYPERFKLNIKADTRTKQHRAWPVMNSTAIPRYTKVGYKVRYRYLRQKMTPSPGVRQKRFVIPTTQPPRSNGTLPENGTNEQPRAAEDANLRSSTHHEWKNNGSRLATFHNHTSWSSNSTTVTTSSMDLEGIFEPIRLKLHFDDTHIDYPNTSEEYERLTENLHLAVAKIEQILKVVPVQGPLLFRRSSENICKGFWRDMSQAHSQENQRCGIANNRYDGEKCLDVKIPDDHLAGYAIYKNNDDPNPMTILYENGTGLADTDTVIYIHAHHTNLCNDKGVIAYATYCQLDQYSRPIAGFANFCPKHLTDVLYDRETLYLTAIHEFFHALGFSKDLFDRFQECYARKVETTESEDAKDSNDHANATEMEWVCEKRGKTISFLQNRKHIITPAVARETRDHLNCSSKQGCPLEDHLVMPLRTSSHWEARFMQGSLMSPMIGMTHLTVIDRITLGAFEDMGWYKVNYSQAEDLAWGKNAGCNFATESDCVRQNSPYFCNRRSSVRGCHFLHLDKGTCETTKYLDNCRLYRPHVGSECWRQKNETKLTQWKGEIYSQESRCFISNLASENSRYVPINAAYISEGRCYMHRCNDSETLEVKVEGSDWRLCPDGEEIEFDGFKGHLKCPSASLICAFAFKTTIIPTVPPTTTYPRADPYCASIKITFPGINALHARLQNGGRVAIEAQHKIDLFLKKFVNEIVAVTDMNSTRIIDVHFVTSNTVQFMLMKNLDWSTLSPKDPKSSLDPSDYALPEEDDHVPLRYNFKEVSCEEAVRRLLTSVVKGEFKVPVDGKVYKANNMTFETADKEADKLHEILVPPKKPPPSQGTIAAAAVGAVCGTMLVSVGVILYWKSQVTSAVSPAPPSPTAMDVRYHPNNGTTVTSSEAGSFGQLAFTA